MANKDQPNGAIAVDNLGGPINAKLNPYTVSAAGNPTVNIFPGDWITMDATTGTVLPAAAGDPILGVCAGIEVAAPTQSDGFLSNNNIGVTEHPGYLPAATAGTILVNDNPDQLYLIQTSGSLALTDVQGNVEIVAGTGSTTTGRSAHEINTTVTAATAQIRLVRPDGASDNDLASANSKWIVRINEHLNSNTVGLAP